LYLSIVVVGSAGIEGSMFLDGRPITQQPGAVMLLMWLPALSSLVARLTLREGFADISLRLCPRDCLLSAWAVAWLYPVAVGLLAYGAAFALGLIEARVPGSIHRILGEAPALPLALSTSLGINLTRGTVLAAITATGEEMGWRGYMLTRLIDVGVPRPVLVSGLIWGAWHLPLILSGQYASGPYPALSGALFMLTVLPAGFVAAEVRLTTGSVWPAVLLHSSWNAVIQGTFDAFTRGQDAAHGHVWVGESGLFVGICSIAVATLSCAFLRSLRSRAAA